MAKDLEHLIQAQIIGEIRIGVELGELDPNLGKIYAVPNGGLRDIRTATKLKNEGVAAGVPDLCLPVARAGYFGLYIEMKTPTGKVRENQVRKMAGLRRDGYMVEIERTAEGAMKLLKWYVGQYPTRRFIPLDYFEGAVDG